jgi:hypothetical protein
MSFTTSLLKSLDDLLEGDTVTFYGFGSVYINFSRKYTYLQYRQKKLKVIFRTKCWLNDATFCKSFYKV